MPQASRQSEAGAPAASETARDGADGADGGSTERQQSLRDLSATDGHVVDTAQIDKSEWRCAGGRDGDDVRTRWQRDDDAMTMCVRWPQRGTPSTGAVTVR